MPFDPIYLAYGAIFLFVLLLVEGLYYLLADSRRGGGRNINRRLQMLASGADSREVLYKLRRISEKKGGKSFTEAIQLVGPRNWLDDLINQSGLTISTSKMLGVMAAMWGGIFILFAGVMTMPTLRSLFIALIPSIGLPILYLMNRKRTRLKRFLEQFPDTLDFIVRSLRAGHPLSTSMSLVSKEMPDPIGTEFGIAVDEMTYGLDMRDAFLNMSKRLPLQDLQYLVVAINIQHGTGGNLAEVLDGLSKVIRERFHMFSKVKALSAEGRMSAMILSILPIGVTGAVWAINPRYFMDVIDDPLFLIMMGGGVVLLVSGILIMWKMVRFKV